MPSLAQIAAGVRDHVERSSREFRARLDAQGRLWVVKYFPPRFLAAFVRDPRLPISATPGFTWGDGVYVVPLDHPYSSMMYGRVGVVGWLADADVGRAYVANDAGVALYQQWIRRNAFMYRMLTTTVHADYANRYLRNRFRRSFGIDVVDFPPDQFNRAYVVPARDRWLCVSDWAGLSAVAVAQQPRRSPRIRECEWVAVVGEEFEQSGTRITYRDLIGSQLYAGSIRSPVAGSPGLASQLLACHAANRAARSASPPGSLRILMVPV